MHSRAHIYTYMHTHTLVHMTHVHMHTHVCVTGLCILIDSSLQTMFSVNVYIFLMGLLSAFSPNYGSLLLLRGLVGLGVGGAFVG